MADDPKQLISAEKLCALTGKTDRRHRQLAKDGYFPPPINGEYQLSPTIAGFLRYVREQAIRAKDTIGKEHLAKTTAERHMVELDLARARKELLPARDVERAWVHLLSEARAAWLQLPPKCAVAFPTWPDARACEAWVAQQVREILDELSANPRYERTHEEEDRG